MRGMSYSAACWIYDGCLVGGYGQATVAGSHVYTHRASYEALVGPIPDGFQIDHLCRTPACYNPAHLEPVTAAENLHRSRLARGYLSTEHGLSGYTNRGCRCDVCRAANTDYQRTRRAARYA